MAKRIYSNGDCKVDLSEFKDIIDNSVSCFGEISRSHSFQIIRELLSPLQYLDISKFDIILTTNTSPLILCSDIDSQKCLKKESTFWIGLFNYYKFLVMVVIYLQQ